MTSSTSLAVLAAIVLSAVSCSGDGESSVTPDTADTSVTAPSSSSSTLTTTTVAAPSVDPVESVAELRRALGADSVVAEVEGVVVAVSDLGETEVPDDYPGVHRDHLVVDNTIVDYAGQPVCDGFEVLGDFHVIVAVESVEGSVIATVEDRRALESHGGEGPVEIPRWSYDCEGKETTELAPRRNVEHRAESTVETITTSAESILIAEWGLGDTPLRMTTQDGTVLIDTAETAYDYVLSPDAQTVYFVTYSGTGAASPPNGVVAVDTATGKERWRLGEGGFVWPLGNQLIVHLVDPTAQPELGVFAGREIALIEPDTGDELDRFSFEGRLLGLFGSL